MAPDILAIPQGGPGAEMIYQPRNLVVCLDGTSNQFSSKNTNVIKLFSVIESDPTHQLVYYDSGVGTYLPAYSGTWSKLKQQSAKAADLAIAWNFDDHVQHAYRWLMDYYQKEDRIYLFGFSRGAYAVRALAGMIEKIGLLPAGNHSQIGLAYSVYKAPEVVSKAGNLPTHDLAKAYRRVFGISKTVNVHFIGVWDTVSSLGAVNLPELPFASHVKMVKFFRQALALDERRARFEPEYRKYDQEERPPNLDPFDDRGDQNRKGDASPALKCYIEQGQGPNHLGGDLGGDEDNQVQIPRNKEVWFLGCHCDCGGGAQNNDELPSLSNISFRWMLREAEGCGLLINAVGLCLSPAFGKNFAIRPHLPQDLLRILESAHYNEQRNSAQVRALVGAYLPPDRLHEIINSAAGLDSVLYDYVPAGQRVMPDWLQNPKESLTWAWLPLEYVWLQLKVYEGSVATRKLGRHKQQPRKILSTQSIHRSVLQRLRYIRSQAGRWAAAAGPAAPYTSPRATLPVEWGWGTRGWELLQLADPDAAGVWEC